MSLPLRGPRPAPVASQSTAPGRQGPGRPRLGPAEMGAEGGVSGRRSPTGDPLGAERGDGGKGARCSKQTIRGQVFCSYLALVLRKALQDRLTAAGAQGEWGTVVAKLKRFGHVDVERDGKKYRIRSRPAGCAGRVFQATGVALPRAVQQTGAVEATS